MKTDPYHSPPASSDALLGWYFSDSLEAHTDLQLEISLTIRPRVVGVSGTASAASAIKQPLTAIAHYAYACERMLSLPDPDIGEVRRALREICSQTQRAAAAMLASAFATPAGEVDVGTSHAPGGGLAVHVTVHDVMI
jgi:hypothetical protein